MDSIQTAHCVATVDCTGTHSMQLGASNDNPLVTINTNEIRGSTLHIHYNNNFPSFPRRRYRDIETVDVGKWGGGTSELWAAHGELDYIATMQILVVVRPRWERTRGARR